MKVGIFGDSWADNTTLFRRIEDDEPWVTILQKKYDIKNFAESGSSLFFSATQFLNNYKKFEKIIFIATDCSRLLLPEISRLNTGPGTYTQHATHHTCQVLMNTAIFYRGNNQKILTAVDQYYRYVCNDQADQYHYKLTINDIQSKMPREKLLILETMSPIYQKEDRYYQSQGYDMNLYQEWKNCHMTNTNNIRMAELVEQWLNDPTTRLTKPGSNDIDESIFFDPVNDPIEKYYKKR